MIKLKSDKFCRVKLVLFVGLVLIQTPSLVYSADKREIVELSPNERAALNRLLGHNPILYNKWSEVTSNGTKGTLLKNSEINLRPIKKNEIAIKITVKEVLDENRNNVAIVNLAYDDDIKYEIDKLMLADLLANTIINSKTVNLASNNQLNIYDAVVDLDTYNSITKSIINLHSIDNAKGVVKINDVIYLE